MTECETYSDDGERPCQCPKCKGFLKWVYNKEDGEYQPVCNKCHAPLVKIPDADSDVYESGKICILKPLDDNNNINEVKKNE